jgi:hypothetical protein
MVSGALAEIQASQANASRQFELDPSVDYQETLQSLAGGKISLWVPVRSLRPWKWKHRAQMNLSKERGGPLVIRVTFNLWEKSVGSQFKDQDEKQSILPLILRKDSMECT